MKKTSFAAAALAFSGMIAGTAMAEDVTLTACTKDGKTATLKVDVAGTMNTPGDNAAAPLSLKTAAGTAFTKAANGLDGDALMGMEGYMAFMTNLHEATNGLEPSDDAAFALAGKPTLVPDAPACKI